MPAPSANRPFARNRPGSEVHPGCASRKWFRKFHAWDLSGRRPVMKLLREGPQTACWQYARSNTVPLAASAIKLGVCRGSRGVFPTYGSMSGRRSSTTTWSTENAEIISAQVELIRVFF